MAGFWEFPGGKIERGETPEVCLARELKEELNVEIKIEKHFLNSEYHDSGKSILLMTYIATIFGKEDIQIKDHDQVLWVKKEELTNYTFSPADVAVVKALVGDRDF